MGPFIIIALRLLVPLTIFRWKLFGGILALIIDAIDVILITFIGAGDFSSYHSLDKLLDMYYLAFELYVSLAWTNLLARNTSIGLFLYRFIGFVLFEITGIRLLLFIFANVFEHFYLFYLGYKKLFGKDPIITVRRAYLVIAILFILKLPQEYPLHYLELQPWNWAKARIFNQT